MHQAELVSIPHANISLVNISIGVYMCIPTLCLLPHRPRSPQPLGPLVRGPIVPACQSTVRVGPRRVVACQWFCAARAHTPRLCWWNRAMCA